MKKIKLISLVFVILLSLVIVSSTLPKIYADRVPGRSGKYGFYTSSYEAKNGLFERLYAQYKKARYIPVDLDTVKVGGKIIRIDAIFLPPYEKIKSEDDKQKFIKKTDLILHLDRGIINLDDLTSAYGWKDKYGKDSKYYVTTTEDLLFYDDAKGDNFSVSTSDESYRIKYTYYKRYRYSKDKKPEWRVKWGYKKDVRDTWTEIEADKRFYTAHPKMIKYSYDGQTEKYFKR